MYYIKRGVCNHDCSCVSHVFTLKGVVYSMEEIFKQYGAPIIIVSVIVALIVIFGLLLKADNTGVIYTQFKNLITDFFNKANFTSGAAGETPGVIIAGILG